MAASIMDVDRPAFAFQSDQGDLFPCPHIPSTQLSAGQLPDGDIDEPLCRVQKDNSPHRDTLIGGSFLSSGNVRRYCETPGQADDVMMVDTGTDVEDIDETKISSQQDTKIGGSPVNVHSSTDYSDALDECIEKLKKIGAQGGWVTGNAGRAPGSASQVGERSYTHPNSPTFEMSSDTMDWVTSGHGSASYVWNPCTTEMQPNPLEAPQIAYEVGSDKGKGHNFDLNAIPTGEDDNFSQVRKRSTREALDKLDKRARKKW